MEKSNKKLFKKNKFSKRSLNLATVKITIQFLYLVKKNVYGSVIVSLFFLFFFRNIKVKPAHFQEEKRPKNTLKWMVDEVMQIFKNLLGVKKRFQLL